MPADLMPGAEPFFFRGGPVGALLIHGFTGAPKEMRPLGEALAAEGYTALGVRLTHHGTEPEDMSRSRWRDWYNAALDGYYLLRGSCSRLFVMGLSMGGAITLRLSAHFPVAGLVAMSAPSRPLADKMGWRAEYAGLLSYLRPYLGKAPSPTPGPAAPDAHVSYAVYPTRAIPQLRALLRASAADLPRLTAPALIVHSHGDRTVPDENAAYIFEHLGSTAKEALWLEKSDHVVTEDCEREQLFARIIAFVRRHSPQERA